MSKPIEPQDGDVVFNGEPIISDVRIPVPVYFLLSEAERDELRGKVIEDYKEWLRLNEGEDVGSYGAFQAGAACGVAAFWRMMERKNVRFG